jgi:mono/diheme cytochrome c family protein
MPAFKDQLADRQINDIIAWFQSRWPDEIYQAWYQRDQRFRAKQAND